MRIGPPGPIQRGRRRREFPASSTSLTAAQLERVSGLTNHSNVTQALVTSAGSPNSTHCGAEGLGGTAPHGMPTPVPPYCMIDTRFEDEIA